MYTSTQAKMPTGRRAEIQNQLNQQLPELGVGNASREWLIMHYNGTPYVCPPEGTSNHPRTKRPVDSDGILWIKDDIRRNPQLVREAERLVRIGKRAPGFMPPMNEVKAKAYDIVNHLLQKHEQRGLYLLSRDPAETEARKRNARERARRFELEAAEKSVASYHRRADKFQADPANNGRKLPMSSKERDSMDLIQNAEDEANYQDGRMLCPGNNAKCGYWTYSEQSLQVHVAKQHANEKIDMEAAAPAPTPEKKARKTKTRVTPDAEEN